MSVLEWSRVYLDASWHVFPVEPRGKRPLKGLENGKDHATTDEKMVHAWFASRHDDPNIGISCAPSQIVVVDVDLPKAKNKHTDGRLELAALVEELGELPTTPTQDTGSGGVQYFFRAPAGVPLIGKAGRAIDIIANGYVVAPPSVHPDGGTYQWRSGYGPDEIAIAELPRAWVEYLRQPEPSAARAPSSPAHGEDFYEALASLDQRRVLECLSGTSLVNGERFAFKPTRAGKYNLFVDRGDGFEGTSNFIAADGTIGARRSGGKDGGPTVASWLRWYGHDDKRIRHELPGLVHELERFKVGARPPKREPELPSPSGGDAPRSGSGHGDQNDPRPRIVISTNKPEIVDAAERALRQMGGVYVRSGQLVRVVRDRGASDWLKRPDGAPVIVSILPAHLEELLCRAATWISIKDGIPHETSAPAWAVAMLAARNEWNLPHLEGLSDAPVFRADGTILDEPGYDGQTRIIFDSRGAVFPPVPLSPTQADARRAFEELVEPFSEFPFVDSKCDRAATAALILSCIARAAIDGPVPMFSSQAPTPGSGKGLLVDAVATIVTGRRAPLMPPTDNEDETRKRLLAVAVESPTMIVIDNVEGSIGSPALAMALTAGEVRDRLLGMTKIVTASLRAIWCITGNNIQLKGDLGRRVVPIDLDPKVEHPEDRTFKRGNLLACVAARRPQLVAAALTILRAFVVAGRPSHGLPPKGSFEQWDRLIRGAIIFAGGGDPLGGVQRIRDASDADLDQLRALLVAWHDMFGSMATTVSEAIKKTGGSGELHEAMGAYCRGGKPDARQLGFVLRKVKGRVVGGLRFERHSEDRDGVARWVVVVNVREEALR